MVPSVKLDKNGYVLVRAWQDKRVKLSSTKRWSKIRPRQGESVRALNKLMYGHEHTKLTYRETETCISSYTASLHLFTSVDASCYQCLSWVILCDCSAQTRRGKGIPLGSSNECNTGVSKVPCSHQNDVNITPSQLQNWLWLFDQLWCGDILDSAAVNSGVRVNLQDGVQELTAISIDVHLAYQLQKQNQSFWFWWAYSSRKYIMCFNALSKTCLCLGLGRKRCQVLRWPHSVCLTSCMTSSPYTSIHVYCTTLPHIQNLPSMTARPVKPPPQSTKDKPQWISIAWSKPCSYDKGNCDQNWPSDIQKRELHLNEETEIVEERT